jgi:dsRNA-specific ribonuclease
MRRFYRAAHLTRFPTTFQLCLVVPVQTPSVPSFDLMYRSNRIPFPVIPPSQPVEFSAESMKLATKYTLRLMSWVSRKKWECPEDKMPFHLLPIAPKARSQTRITSTDDLDWEQIEYGAINGPAPLGGTSMLEDADTSLVDRILLTKQDERATASFSFVCVDQETEKAIEAYDKARLEAVNDPISGSAHERDGAAPGSAPASNAVAPDSNPSEQAASVSAAPAAPAILSPQIQSQAEALLSTPKEFLAALSTLDGDTDAALTASEPERPVADPHSALAPALVSAPVESTCMSAAADKDGPQEEEKTVLPAPRRRFEVGFFERLTNMLVMTSQLSRTRRGKRRFTIVAETSWLHPIYASTARSALLVPSIIARMDHSFVAREINRTFFANSLSNELITVAMTAPAANFATDYQRLEFIGDTCLKFLASCHVFASSASFAEGELHLGRRAIICNAQLLKYAKKYELWRYLQGASFTRRSYKPPNFEEVDPIQRPVPVDRKSKGKNRKLNSNTKEPQGAKAKECDPAEAGPQQMDTAEGPDGSAAVDEEGSNQANGDAAAEETSPAEEVLKIFPRSDPDGPFRPTLLSGKGLADIVEALIGVGYECHGLQGALDIAVTLKVLPTPVKSLSDYA